MRRPIIVCTLLLTFSTSRFAAADGNVCTSEVPDALDTATIRDVHRAARQDESCKIVLDALANRAVSEDTHAACFPLIEKVERFCNRPLLADLGAPSDLATPADIEAARRVVGRDEKCQAVAGDVTTQGPGAFGLGTPFQDDLLRGLAAFIVLRAKAEAMAWAIDAIGNKICGNEDAAALLPNSCELLSSADPASGTSIAWGTLKTAFETDLERFPERAMSCVAKKARLGAGLGDLLVVGVQIVRQVREGEDPLAVLAGLDERFTKDSCPQNKLRCGMHMLGFSVELLAPNTDDEGYDELANEARFAQIALRRLWEYGKDVGLVPEADAEKFETLAKELDPLRKEILSAAKAIDPVKREILGVLDKIAATKKKLESAKQAAKPALANEIKELEKKLKLLDEKLKPLEDRLKPLEEKLKPLEEKLKAGEEQLNTLATKLLALYGKIRQVAENVIRVRKALAATTTDSDRSQSYVRLVRAAVDVVDSALALVPDSYFGDGKSGKSLKKRANKVLDVLDEVAAAIDAAIEREYARTFVHATAAVKLLASSRAATPAKVKLPSVITQYGPFIAEVAAAKTPEDVQAALEAAAAPVGGSLAKRGKGKRTIAINAFFGFAGGGEVVDGTGDKTITGGQASLYAAVGVEASKGCGTHSSIGLFLSVIDLGAVTSLHFGNEDEMAADDHADVETTPEVGVAQVFSPGLYVTASYKRATLGVGASLTPKLRNVTDDGMFVEEATALRFGGFVALDITIFPF